MFWCGVELLKSTGQIQQTSHSETSSKGVTLSRQISRDSVLRCCKILKEFRRRVHRHRSRFPWQTVTVSSSTHTKESPTGKTSDSGIGLGFGPPQSAPESRNGNPSNPNKSWNHHIHLCNRTLDNQHPAWYQQHPWQCDNLESGTSRPAIEIPRCYQ